MLVAFDEGPGPPIRYQYAELGKLYSVVSQLVRCCDVSSRMRSSITVRNFLIYSTFQNTFDKLLPEVRFEVGNFIPWLSINM